MKYDIIVLKSKQLPELRSILASKGHKWHPREKAETLIQRIQQIDLVIQPSDKYTKEDTMKSKKKTVSFNNTQEEILKEIQEYTDKGLKVDFLEDGCWTFSYKGAMDSGTSKQPLSVIKRKAELVSKGARKPVKVKIGEDIVMSA